MAVLAAHLVNGVFGDLPVRQWVLTLPHRLRYALAYDPPLCRAVLGVFVRALLALRQAQDRGSSAGGRGRAASSGAAAPSRRSSAAARRSTPTCTSTPW
jgi:hypothetical protein